MAEVLKYKILTKYKGCEYTPSEDITGQFEFYKDKSGLYVCKLNNLKAETSYCALSGYLDPLSGELKILENVGNYECIHSIDWIKDKIRVNYLEVYKWLSITKAQNEIRRIEIFNSIIIGIGTIILAVVSVVGLFD